LRSIVGIRRAVLVLLVLLTGEFFTLLTHRVTLQKPAG